MGSYKKLWESAMGELESHRCGECQGWFLDAPESLGQFFVSISRDLVGLNTETETVRWLV